MLLVPTDSVRHNAAMFRAVAIVALLALTAGAAPRLKDRPTVPTAEDVRIAALKAKYEGIQRTGSPAERQELESNKFVIDVLSLVVDLAKQSGDQKQTAAAEAKLRETLDRSQACRELYDIRVYDRARK
jgi:hypothetical protein